MTVGRAGPEGKVRLHSERRITTTHDNSTQSLTVLDGGRAFLRVGESIPTVQPFLVLVGDRLGAVTGVQYYDVTTGFEVEPPTVLMVRPGEWVDLGGAVESTNEVNRQILGTRRDTSNVDSRFLVRVDPPKLRAAAALATAMNGRKCGAQSRPYGDERGSSYSAASLYSRHLPVLSRLLKNSPKHQISSFRRKPESRMSMKTLILNPGHRLSPV